MELSKWMYELSIVSKTYLLFLAIFIGCVSTTTEESASDMRGVQVPDITGIDPNGNSHSLYDLENKYIVLHLMDADCSECLNTLMDLDQVVRNAKIDLDLDLFSVGMGMSLSEWQGRLKEQPINGTTIYLMGDKSGIARSLKVSSLPKLFVLNKKKIIKAGPFSHPDDLEYALHDLLN